MPRRLLAVAMETAYGSQPKMPQPPLSLLSQPLPPGAPAWRWRGCLGTSGRGEGLGLACAAPPRGHTWQRTALASQSQKDGGRSAACQGLWALGTITPAYKGSTSERLGVQPRTRGAGPLPGIADTHCHALRSAPHTAAASQSPPKRRRVGHVGSSCPRRATGRATPQGRQGLQTPNSHRIWQGTLAQMRPTALLLASQTLATPTCAGKRWPPRGC